MAIGAVEPPVQDWYRTATDEQLLLRYRDHSDMEAFETLVHRYAKPLHSYLVRYLHSAVLAEEVFQATFLRVHRNCGMFAEDREVRPWIYSIATNLAIDALRTEGRQHAVSLDEAHADGADDASKLLDLLQSTGPSPAQELESSERAEWARKAVEALPHDLRLTLLLIYFQGLKYREVAEILQVPLGTVKSRVHQALLALNRAWRRSHQSVE